MVPHPANRKPRNHPAEWGTATPDDKTKVKRPAEGPGLVGGRGKLRAARGTAGKPRILEGLRRLDLSKSQRRRQKAGMQRGGRTLVIVLDLTRTRNYICRSAPELGFFRSQARRLCRLLISSSGAAGKTSRPRTRRRPSRTILRSAACAPGSIPPHQRSRTRRFVRLPA